MFNDLTTLFSYLGIIYLTGLIVSILLFKTIIRKHNLFIQLPLFWSVGCFFAMSALSVLAYTGNLHMVSVWFGQATLVIAASLAVLLIAIFRKSFQASWKWRDIFVLMLIILFFVPLMKDAIFSYLLAWDAIAIWSLKAKSFFYSNSLFGSPFYTVKNAYEYAHKSYPIGFPLLTAGYYRLIGYVNDQSVQLLHLQFYLHIVLLFYGFMRTVLKKISILTSLLFTLSIFTAAHFIMYSHNGFADLPLSLIFGLCTALFIFLYNEKELALKVNYASVILIVSALGALIKNEGYAFFLLVNSASFILLYSQLIQKPKHLLKLGLTGAAAAFPILLWEVAKRKLGINLDSYLAGARIYPNSVSRMVLIYNYYLNEMINVAKYGILFIPSLLLFVFEWTYLIKRKRLRELVPALLIAGQLGFYTLVYFVTPIALEWQVKTSVERLLLHLLPAFFIIVVYQAVPFFDAKKQR